MIRIVEVGPRDGLQNEKARIPTAVKAAFVDALSDTGVTEVEVSAFVSPLRIPQLADAAEVFKKKCAACHGKEGEPNKIFAKQGVRSFKDAEW